MFTAIIPVRAGSVRVKNKNIQPFADSNLLIHKIRQLKNVESIDSIVVSSDSEVMLEMASSEGVNVHNRSWEFCDEKTASFGEVVKNICESVDGEHIVWSLCTAPLIMPEHYESAVSFYLDNLPEFDSLISVLPFKKYVWDDKGPVNFNTGSGHVPSQQLPQYYMTTGLRIAPRQKMIDWVYFTGSNPMKFELPEMNCIDIDNEFDLQLARIVYDNFIANSQKSNL